MEKEVKHDGCKWCGSKEEPILTSVVEKGQYMGSALCSNCLQKAKDEKKIIGT